MYLATLCEGCGQDKFRSMNPDMGGFYDVHEVECLGCSALEHHREQRKDRSGTAWKQFVIDTRPPDDIPRPWVLDLTPKHEEVDDD